MIKTCAKFFVLVLLPSVLLGTSVAHLLGHTEVSGTVSMQLQTPDLVTAMQYFLKLFNKVPETSILIKLSFIWISLILVSGGIEVFRGKKVDSTFLYRNFQTFFLLFFGYRVLVRILGLVMHLDFGMSLFFIASVLCWLYTLSKILQNAIKVSKTFLVNFETKLQEADNYMVEKPLVFWTARLFALAFLGTIVYGFLRPNPLGDFAIFSYQLVNSLWVFSSKIACQFGGEEFQILGIGWGRNFFKATKKILRLEVIAPIVVLGVVDEVHRQNQVEILDTRFKDSLEMAKNYPPGSIENKALTDDAISNREAASKIAQGGPYRILKTFLSNHWKTPTE